MGGRIVIVEDEEITRRELKILLENAMYEAVALDSFERAAAQIISLSPDLVLLDVNLPGCSGFDVCTQLRQETDVPVIFLTSRTDSMDELSGILKGGDDYITKPYQAPILLARIMTVLKRTSGSSARETTQFTVRGVRLDISRCTLSRGKLSADLTKNEMKILSRLYVCPGQYVARTDLIEYLWENQIFIDDNTLSVHVTRIREKLRSIGAADFIETKRGIGYRI